jgi:putative ABC transport system permease protein
MTQGLRLQTDQMLVVSGGGCTPAFRDAVRQLPGVRGAACSLGAPLAWFRGMTAARPGGGDIIMGEGLGDFGLLELYGIEPVAGRFLDPNVTADEVPQDEAGFTKHIVLNEQAARDLGFGSPSAAVGQEIRWHDLPAVVVGIAPDFRLTEEGVRKGASDIGYVVVPSRIQQFRDQSQLHIKLSGRDLPETLAAIDSLWRSVGLPRPISRFFVDAHVQASYADVVRQAEIFAMFAAMALLVACLGLFGLSAFAAEERTKEIGIRKAMGASVREIVGMLLWQFAKPVLWANVIAWPAAYFIMRRWLQGFAYRVDIAPWMFVAASALALTIAALTVLGHALLVARSQPVTALRYE